MERGGDGGAAVGSAGCGGGAEVAGVTEVAGVAGVAPPPYTALVKVQLLEVSISVCSLRKCMIN